MILGHSMASANPCHIRPASVPRRTSRCLRRIRMQRSPNAAPISPVMKICSAHPARVARPGTTLNIGNQALSIGGPTFTNNGTLIANAANAALNFDGSVPQLYAGSGSVCLGSHQMILPCTTFPCTLGTLLY